MSDTAQRQAGEWHEAEERRAESATSGWRARHRRLLGSRDFAITLVAIVLFAGFALAVDRFLTTDSLFNMLRQVAPVGIVAVGMTYLLIAGEIDISVGSVYGFLAVVMGILVVREGCNPWLGFVAVVGLGAVIGLVNGLIVTKTGIHSFIVTLAMMTAYRSGSLLVSGEQPSVTQGKGLFYDLTGTYIQGTIPCPVVWMLLIMTVGGVVLAKTKFGFHLYATGGSPEAARNKGIDTDQVRLICFIVTGALCGLIAALLFGWLHVAATATGTGFEFRVIAAVIVGGVALTGGRGSIYGAFTGAVILGMVSSALVLSGFSQQWKDVATGAIIMFTATLDWAVRHIFAHSVGHLRE